MGKKNAGQQAQFVSALHGGASRKASDPSIAAPKAVEPKLSPAPTPAEAEAGSKRLAEPSTTDSGTHAIPTEPKKTKVSVALLGRAIASLGLDRRRELEAQHFGCAFPQTVKPELAVRLVAEQYAKVALDALPQDIRAALPTKGAKRGGTGNGGTLGRIRVILGSVDSKRVEISALASQLHEDTKQHDVAWWTKRVRSVLTQARVAAKKGKAVGVIPTIVEYVSLPR